MNMKNEMIAELVKGSGKYKKTEVGMIPEDWDVFQLRDLGEFKNGINKSAEDFGFGFPLVNLLDVFGKTKIENVYQLGLINSSVWEQKQYNLKAGDVLFIRSSVKPSGVGLTCLINQNLDATVYSGFIIRFRDFGRLEHSFKQYCFHNSTFRNHLINSSSVSANTNINQESLKNLLLAIPSSFTEQISIAEALSDADAMIESLEKLIDKKKKIKQGAMLELLSSTGSDGKLKEGWTKKKLGDVCEIRKGQLITDSTRVDGDVPVIAGGKTPAYFHNKSNRKKNTITISGSGASAGYVSFHSYPIFASDCSTIESSEKYSVEYIYYFLQLNQERIYRMQTGGAQPHIHPSDLFPLTISMPSLELQNYISNSILDMDREITMLVEKLNKAIQIKQGMMQNLLTGKIRLV